MLSRSLACQQESTFSNQAPVPEMPVHGCKAARGV